MNTIRQRVGFQSRAYTLDPKSDFIEVEFNTIKEKLKYKFHLTEVGTETQYQADNVLIRKIFLGLSTAIAVFCTAYYFLGIPEDPGTYVGNSIVWEVISICGIFFSAKDDLLSTNGNKLITLFRNKHNQEQALEFANLLIRKTNEKKKEMLINFDFSEDQFNTNIHWLHLMRMIYKTELAQLQADFNLTN